MTTYQPAEQCCSGPILDMERQAVLRGLGPDDGWGLFPQVAEAFLQDCPTVITAMRHSVEIGDAIGFGESAHRLLGSAANLGATNVAALCQRVARCSSAPPDGVLFAHLEAELDRATRLLRDALPDAR